MLDHNTIKRRWYSIAILLLVYLIVNGIPFSYFIKNELIVFIISIVIKLAFIAFAIIYIKKEDLECHYFSKIKIYALFIIPTFVLCISNYFVPLFLVTPISNNFNVTIFLKDMSSYLLIAFIEEVIFRLLILELLLEMKNKPYLAIIISSLLFGLTHLVNINSIGSIIPTIIQCGYTFVLGLVLGFIYYLTRSIPFVFLFHFLFNLMNNTLFSELYEVSLDMHYFLINGLIGLFVLSYSSLTYYLIEKKYHVSEDF